MSDICASDEGLPVPVTGVFDSPGIVLELNTDWASFLDGLLGQLLNPCVWAGSEIEQEYAVQQISELLIKLADVEVF